MPQDLRGWIDRYHTDQCGAGVVFAVLVRWGMLPRAAADAAEDARQEAVTRVLAKYGYQPGRFRDYSHFANTVTRTATNWLRDQRRKDRGHAAVFDEDLAAPAPDPRPVVVRKAMTQLDQADRDLITAAVIDGRTLDDLAAEFLDPSGASENARRLKVRRLLLAAIDRLRERYAENDTE